NFSGRWTGFDIADFMLGLPFSSSRLTPVPADIRHRNEWSGYILDDIKWSSKLSTTLGLRYEYFTQFRSEHDFASLFDPATGQIVVPSQRALNEIPQGLVLPVPVVTASSAGFPPSLIEAPKNQWEPRVATAYRFRSTSVVRAGF